MLPGHGAQPVVQRVKGGEAGAQSFLKKIKGGRTEGPGGWHSWLASVLSKDLHMPLAALVRSEQPRQQRESVLAVTRHPRPWERGGPDTKQRFPAQPKYHDFPGTDLHL